MSKGQSMSLNTIVVCCIVVLVLIVLSVIFIRSSGHFVSESSAVLESDCLCNLSCSSDVRNLTTIEYVDVEYNIFDSKLTLANVSPLERKGCLAYLSDTCYYLLYGVDDILIIDECIESAFDDFCLPELNVTKYYFKQNISEVKGD